MLFRNRFVIDIQAFDACYSKIPMFRIAKIMKCLSQAAKSDGLQPELVEQHDKFFTPKDENEENLWIACREACKKDIKRLLDNVENGKKGGRPVKSIQEIIASASPVGKNQILITEDFNNLPDCEYFNAYKKEFSSQEIKNIINWLKKNYLDKKVDYDWIGKQLQNFRKRKTGRVI